MATAIQVPQSIEEMIVNIRQEIHVNASLEDTFEALLEQVGPANEGPDGQPIPMKLEAWPGGRWYRDLSNNNGHLWAHVQAIKRPTLLEFTGPLMASFPFSSNVQYRLSQVEGGTLIKFQHLGFGFVPPEHKAGMNKGWNWVLERTRRAAEAH
jgi:uncharacterized protein YndB with AHSA1/START domain